jgi:hypothetical protein
VEHHPGRRARVARKGAAAPAGDLSMNRACVKDALHRAGLRREGMLPQRDGLSAGWTFQKDASRREGLRREGCSASGRATAEPDQVLARRRLSRLARVPPADRPSRRVSVPEGTWKRKVRTGNAATALCPSSFLRATPCRSFRSSAGVIAE